MRVLFDPPPQRLSSGSRRPLLQVTSSQHHGVTVVSVSGELDASNASPAAEMLTRMLEDTGGLIVDLSGLRFCSVAGVEVIMYFDRRCRGAARPWILVTGPAVDRVVQHVGAVLPTTTAVEAHGLLVGADRHRQHLRLVR